MEILRRRVRALVASLLLLPLCGCDLQGRDQMSWARAALERNSSLEVVATDQQGGTFTVRVKDTGELRVVRADQVIAAPPPSGAASGTISAAAGTAAPAASAEPQTRAAEDAAPPESVPGQPGGPPAGAPGGASASLVPQTAVPIDSSPGRVLESGPGYTIKAASGSRAAASAARGGSFTSAAPERRHEPIICQGARLLHIDNRNLVFDGDAVSAEDGCEIHITNSHITASGVGVLARAANVHIDNSLIEGEQASIDASEGAQVYVTSSQFRGLSRRLDSASVHDLGGNVWN